MEKYKVKYKYEFDTSRHNDMGRKFNATISKYGEETIECNKDDIKNTIKEIVEYKLIQSKYYTLKIDILSIENV